MKNKRNVIITVVIILNILVFLYFKDYIYVLYSLNNNRNLTIENTYELKNTDFIISYLGKSWNSPDKYYKSVFELSNILWYFSIKMGLNDILRLNNENSYNILCINNNSKTQNNDINYFCNQELFSKQEKNINEKFDCSIFNETKINKKCEDKKNQILSDHSYKYCSNIDCKINNIIYWTYRDKSDIKSACSVLNNQIFIDRCNERFLKFILYLKKPNKIDEYDRILNNINLNDVEKIVYKNIYTWYDTIPEQNCLQLNEQLKIKECEIKYKEILDYIDNQKEQIIFKQIKLKTEWKK